MRSKNSIVLLIAVIMVMFPFAIFAATCTPQSAIICVNGDDNSSVWINGNYIGGFNYVNWDAAGSPVCQSVNPALINASGTNVIAVSVTDTAGGQIWGAFTLDVTCSGGTHSYISSDDGGIRLSSTINYNSPPDPNWYTTAFNDSAWGYTTQVTATTWAKTIYDPSSGTVVQPQSYDWYGGSGANEYDMSTGMNMLYMRKSFVLNAVTPVPSPTITIMKIMGPTTMIPDGSVSVTITVCNSGGGYTSSPVLVTDYWTTENASYTWNKTNTWDGGSIQDGLFSYTTNKFYIYFPQGMAANTCKTYYYTMTFGSWYTKDWSCPQWCFSATNYASVTWTSGSASTDVDFQIWCPSSTATSTRTYTPAMTNTFTRTVTPSFTVTNSPSFTFTRTASPSMTATLSWTLSATRSATPTLTITYSYTLTRTSTATYSPSATATFTSTSSRSATPTFTNTATPSFTITPVNTFTNTPTRTNTNAPSPTFSWTLTHTRSFTSTHTPTITVTTLDTKTVTPTNTPSFTASPTSTATGTPSFTPTATATFTPSNTRTITPTVTITTLNTATVTDTVTPTYTGTPTHTATLTFTFSFTVTNTPTSTATVPNPPTQTVTPTFTPSFTVTDTPTDTATMTQTSTDLPTGTATFTPTYTCTMTNTPSFTQTWTGTYTPTDFPTGTSTNTPSYTYTVTVTLTYTVTQTVTYTVTPQGTPALLTIELTSRGDNPGSGAVVTYRIRVVNNDVTPAYNIRVWDTIPSEMYYDSTISLYVTQVNGNYLQWDMPPGFVLNPGEEFAIVFNTVIKNIEEGALVVNTACVDYNDGQYNTPAYRHPAVTSMQSFYPEGIVVVFPNPFDSTTAIDGAMKFANMVPGALLRVYTLSGENVHAVDIKQNTKYWWDCKNRYGKAVSPGIYYWVVKNPVNGRTDTGKIYIVK